MGFEKVTPKHKLLGNTDKPKKSKAKKASKKKDKESEKD